MPPDVEAKTLGTSIRQGKAEEGEARGEGWVLVRALLLIMVVTAVIAAVIA